jgi:hypothetical protein
MSGIARFDNQVSVEFKPTGFVTITEGRDGGFLPGQAEFAVAAGRAVS